MATIAIYGGSFNPPHLGHLLAATAVVAAAGVDAVWIEPVFDHPLGKPIGATFADRVAMCRLGFAALGRRAVVRQDERANRARDGSGVRGRSFDLVDRLSLRFPHHQFRFVIGSDIFAEASRWHRFDDLLGAAPPIILARPGHPVPAAWAAHALAVAMPDLASRDLRRAIAIGSVARGAIATGVLDYIAARRLYAEAP